MTEIEIRTLRKNQKISEPGFYRMPLERHHTQPCDGPSVTSSVLRTIEKESPAQVWAFHQLNKHRFPPPDKKAFNLGTAMHSWVEGGEKCVKRDFVVLPDKPPKRPTPQQWGAAKPSETSQEAMTFWSKIHKRQQRTGQGIITAQEFESIKQAGEVLAADPTAKAVLGGLSEITMAWKDEATGLWCLSRLDNLTFDGLLSDYKRISSRGAPFSSWLCYRRIWEHGYFMQLAFGAEGYMRLLGEWPTDAALVFQLDGPPYHVCTVALGQDELYWGMCLNHRALGVFAECYASGHWPGPADDLLTYTFSEYQRLDLEARQGRGDIPNLPPPFRTSDLDRPDDDAPYPPGGQL